MVHVYQNNTGAISYSMLTATAKQTQIIKQNGLVVTNQWHGHMTFPRVAVATRVRDPPCPHSRPLPCAPRVSFQRYIAKYNLRIIQIV